MNEQSPGEYVRRAARTYGAAADHYGLAPLSFWDRFGGVTVERLRLASGATVLDLCCGHGASAIPAARVVGPAGRVVGVDVAEPMLELARTRAAGEGLANVEFRQGDATSTGLPGGSFDAVVCVFGVFFVADMAAFVAEMWRLVRPGGVLAVTTWGPGCSSRPTAFSGTACGRSSHRCSRPSTRGTRSPAPRPSKTCSRGLASRPQAHKPHRPAILSTTRTGSGISSSGRVTGPLSTLSARSDVTRYARACSAS